ncbi:PhoX family protein [Streptosporangium sp. KLBMP 9127]|nr:PhoX family protein [Streptosporangium sp. KLBMP 9127]
MLRRTFVRSDTLAASAAFAGSLWQGAALAADGPTSRASGPYGPLAPPDSGGVSLPDGFTSRVVARSGHRVGRLRWHAAPDGGACYPDGEGWIYVSNSDIPLFGGASAIRFQPDGSVRDAYRILSGADLNGAGGSTPWHTWLSCEETPRGRVFECDPYGVRAAMPRLAMGRFKHEAAACDPDAEVVYLTEDEQDGCVYRFRPTEWGDLTEGTLEVLCAPAGGGTVTWQRVPSPAALFQPTRHQVPEAVHFDGAAGCYYAAGTCYFTTKGDNRVWAYDATAMRLSVVYDRGEPLSGVGGIAGGDRYVAEDGGIMEINVITPEGVVAPFMRLSGHGRSKITGPAFTPDGRRLYFSSQRGASGASAGTGGVTYEVTGPFRG